MKRTLANAFDYVWLTDTITDATIAALSDACRPTAVPVLLELLVVAEAMSSGHCRATSCPHRIKMHTSQFAVARTEILEGCESKYIVYQEFLYRSKRL